MAEGEGKKSAADILRENTKDSKGDAVKPEEKKTEDEATKKLLDDKNETYENESEQSNQSSFKTRTYH